MGLNSPRPEGTLSSMLSHLTLRIAGMHGAICDPTFFHSVSQWTETLSALDTKIFALVPFQKGTSRSRELKVLNFEDGEGRCPVFRNESRRTEG